MDEALAQVTVDLSNRPFLVFQADFGSAGGRFDPQLVPEFWRAVAQHGGMTLHIEAPYGDNTHHIIEAIFKAAGPRPGPGLGLGSQAPGRALYQGSFNSVSKPA